MTPLRALAVIAALSGAALGAPAPTASRPAASQPAASRPAAPPIVVFTWTDLDVQAAATALSRELLTARWRTAVRARLGRAPRIELREIRNRSSEHLNTDLLRRQLALTLARGGLKVAWRPAGEVYSAAAASAPCPDLLLEGLIVSMDDASDGAELRSHLLGLWLVEPVRGEKLWMGTFQVRKLALRSVLKDGSPKVEVTRLAAERAIDLSGQLNDTDAAAIVRAAVADLLRSPLARSGARAVLRVERLRNRTSYHLSTTFITAQIEAALLRSGKLRVVSSVEDSADDETPARCRKGRKETPTTHALGGTFFAREEKGRVHYQVVLEATSTRNNERAWVMTRSIPKIVHAAASW